MDFILKEEQSGTELLFPVAPEEYTDVTSMNFKKVSAYAVGDVNLFGNAGTSTCSATVFFPTEKRGYTNGSAYVGNPVGARELLDSWCTEKKLLRYIIGGEVTEVNRKCFITSLTWRKGGTDMTDDLYCDIQLAYYTELASASVNEDTDNNSRSDTEENTEKDYTIQSGDTLWAIAKAEYGDGSLCWQLAEYNGIKNANLIKVGDTIKIPPESALEGLTYTGSKVTTSSPTVTKTSSGKTSKVKVKCEIAGHATARAGKVVNADPHRAYSVMTET